MRPYVTVNINVEKMFSELDRQISSHPDKNINYSMGELADSLHLDPITEYSKLLIPYFAEKPNAFLYMLTKSDCVENLIDFDHRGHTIVAWSMNPEIIVQSVENGTASLSERINAALKCQTAGYPIRLRFDPLLPISDWRKHYAEFVEQVLSQLKPERITLGSFRLLGNLKGIIQRCYPDSVLLDIPVVKGTKNTRARLDSAMRIELYEFIIDEIRKYSSSVMIDICKEESEIKKALACKINPGKCVCV